jgi:hypothetical protein
VNRAERISAHIDRESQRALECVRIARRLHKLSQAANGYRLLRISDEFAAIERAAERAKWRSYELYIWLGREEIKWQSKAKRP